jgi:ABC-type polar amino acid transport system ATPase subunit
MSFVYEIADRVLFLDDGLVIEESPPRSVFDSPKTERARQFISRVNIGNNYTL